MHNGCQFLPKGAILNREPVSCCSDFDAVYELGSHPAFMALERHVLGCSYGGTSWTTRAQADRIGGLLKLSADTELLELGSGSGWPSVYVAGKFGCRLTMLDLPMNALEQAYNRAVEELDNFSGAVQASAADLPFASASFDALGHSDVLCCLPEKQQMLDECRRVARPGARMLFYVIAPAVNLEAEQTEVAMEAGPPFVGLDGSYEDMLASSGWHLLERQDVSGAYGDSLQRMVSHLVEHAEPFVMLLGNDEYSAMLKRRQLQVSAVEKGILVREYFLAEADPDD